jgi:hypothetical protein
MLQEVGYDPGAALRGDDERPRTADGAHLSSHGHEDRGIALPLGEQLRRPESAGGARRLQALRPEPIVDLGVSGDHPCSDLFHADAIRDGKVFGSLQSCKVDSRNGYCRGW